MAQWANRWLKIEGYKCVMIYWFLGTRLKTSEINFLMIVYHLPTLFVHSALGGKILFILFLFVESRNKYFYQNSYSTDVQIL